MKKNIEKYSLLSVSLLVVSAGAIAGNIPAIADTYPQINSMFVELITTIPSLFIILTVLISPKIAKKFDYKITVQLGICLVFLSSLVPVLVPNFWFLFISRMIFGIGIGLFNPLLYSFSSSLYSGKELTTVIGLQSSFEGIGGMLLTFIVGQLLKINWEVSFLAYSLTIPILFLFSRFVPTINREKVSTDTNLKKNNTKIGNSQSIIGYIFLLI